jgi:hypothetical protein
MKLLKSHVSFEVPQKRIKQLKLVPCIGDARTRERPRKTTYQSIKIDFSLNDLSLDTIHKN